MRTPIASDNDLRVTIDLTGIAERPFSSRSTDAIARERAIDAFRVTRRHRRVRSFFDTVSDATMTTGGLTLANVAFKAPFGLPHGIGGIALGAGMLLAGAALSIRRKSSSHGPDDPGSSLHTPGPVIVLDEPHRVITLDEGVSSAA